MLQLTLEIWVAFGVERPLHVTEAFALRPNPVHNIRWNRVENSYGLRVEVKCSVVVVLRLRETLRPLKTSVGNQKIAVLKQHGSAAGSSETGRVIPILAGRPVLAKELSEEKLVLNFFDLTATELPDGVHR